MNRIAVIAGVVLTLIFPSTAMAQTLVVPPELVATVPTADSGYEVVLSGAYALVPDFSAGVEIVDVSNPALPVHVGNYNSPGFAIQCAVAGTYVYLADHVLGGLQVVSLDTPSAPSFVGSYISGSSAAMAAWHNGLVLVGYIPDGLDIVDVSNPSQPVLVSSFATVGAPRHAIFDGDLAYIAEYDAGLMVLDISDPAVPAPVATLPADRPLGLDRVGSTIYLACGNGLRTIDVTAPSSPASLDRVVLPGPAVKVVVSGSYALLADHVAGGLQVVDVSDATDLSIATGYVTNRYAHGVAVSGDYAFLADGEGLKVFRVFDSSLPTEPTSFGQLKARYRSK